MTRSGLSEEQISQLRTLYDDGVKKHKAMRITGISEATVYRYYTRWEALTSITAFDIQHLDEDVFQVFYKQARMRRVSMYQLVHRMLTQISRDNLFDAILNISEDNPIKGRLNDDQS